MDVELLALQQSRAVSVHKHPQFITFVHWALDRLFGPDLTPDCDVLCPDYGLLYSLYLCRLPMGML